MDEIVGKAGFFHRLRYLVLPYFRSEEKWTAYGFSALNMLLTLLVVGANYAIVVWNGTFYNAMQAYDVKRIWFLCFLFFVIVAFIVLINTAQQYCIQVMQIRWRHWMTRKLVGAWTHGQTHYRMQLSGKAIDNPDQRISDDVDFFSGQTVNLPISVLQSAVTIISFGVMLWRLSAPLRLFGLYIPGLLLWFNLFYAVGGTAVLILIGKPLFFLNNLQQKVMGDFRFELIRVRDNSETIATARADDVERDRLEREFAPVVEVFFKRIYRTVFVNLFSFAYTGASGVLPFLLVLPSYLAKRIMIGTVSQTFGAFNQTQTAFAFIINNFSSIGQGYLSITQWRAVIDRLYTLEVNLRHYNNESASPDIVYQQNPTPALDIDHLSLALPGGRILLRDLSVHVAPGERLLISGTTGAGKSTLIRAIAGIWPFGEGEVRMPGGQVLFIPQRPYLPNAPLIESLSFPYGRTFDVVDVRAVLGHFGLDRLADRLDDVETWDRELSLGEQQRIAFARAVLLKPDVIILDEATSSLDEQYEALAYRALIQATSSKATIISVGHRSTIARFHRRRLHLAGDGTWRDEPIEALTAAD